MNLSDKRIILGVTGGIAAYKAAFLLRALQKAGAEVRVTMTPDATRFVGVETFSALSKHPVAVEVFPENQSATESWTQHISWGEWADLFVIAPCTANTLAKIVHGLADNMLTSTVLAARCPLLICPTMDGEMYNAAATQRNLRLSKEFGYHILEPEEGYLASGQEGTGRLPEMDIILDKCRQIISGKKKVKGILTGKNVLVTSGPTREHIDPVRYISNPSSGKMGVAMAEAAKNMGAEVTLIHGPVSITIPAGIQAVEIESSEELFNEVKDRSDAEIIIMAAAVSDFTPAESYQHKVKKEDAASEIKLKQTEDILAWLGKNKKDGQVIIGFAMETEDLIQNASKKLKKKNADWIVANSLSEPDSGFQSDQNSVYLIGSDHKKHIEGSQKSIALELLTDIFSS